MNEKTKTGIFGVTAAILALVAYWTMPQSAPNVTDEVEKIVGRPLFEKFTDPDAAATLKIVKYDADLGALKPFELARDKATNAWIIPSHDSYPADAANQISQVANTFVGLKILTLESTKTDDQTLFGVVEPDAGKLKVGDTDVGTLVRMQDEKGETLVDIVIGKTVRDDPKKRYVRRTNSDPIYSAEIDVAPLTTDFSAWIEGDLLKLSSNDISQLTIRDYNIIPTQRGPGELQRNFNATLNYSSRDNKWSPESIVVFRGGDESERVLTDNEQLNSTKLNTIRNTLDTLKIVDVARKPQGLAADLKADKALLDDNAKILSLFKQGFVPGQTADGGLELYSSSGELQVTLNNGVEYLLRFGNTTAGSSSDSDEESDGVSLNRVLFVTARVDESKHPMPELKPLPETIEDLKAMEAAERSTTGNSTLSEEDVDVDFAPVDEATEPDLDNNGSQESSSTSSEDQTTPSDSGATESTDSSADSQADADTPNESQSELETESDSNNQAPANDGARIQNRSATRFVSLLQAETDSETSLQTDADDTTTDESSSDSNAVEQTSEGTADEETEEELRERLEAVREKITRDNQRAIDARNDKLEAAQKSAAELNARFAEWYYEISDNDYKKLRVSLEELIQPKDGEGIGVDGSDSLPDFSNLDFSMPGGF